MFSLIENDHIRNFFIEVYKAADVEEKIDNDKQEYKLVFLTALEWLTGEGELQFDYTEEEFPQVVIAGLPIGNRPNAHERGIAINSLEMTVTKFETLYNELSSEKEDSKKSFHEDDAFSYEKNLLLEKSKLYLHISKDLLEFINFIDQIQTIASAPLMLKKVLKPEELENFEKCILKHCIPPHNKQGNPSSKKKSKIQRI